MISIVAEILYKIRIISIRTEQGFVLPSYINAAYFAFVGGFAIGFGCIILVICNYHYLVKSKKSDPKPKLYRKLLIWSILCLIIDIIVVII